MINETAIEASIKSLLLDMIQNQNQEDSINVYSQRFARIIADAVRSGEVTEQVFTVVTSGGPTNQTGTATQVSKGMIN